MNSRLTLVQGLFAALVLGLASNAMAGSLFIAADTEDFAGILPDRLGVWDVSGTTVNSSMIINTPFHLNGLADAGGKLLTGNPLDNTLRYVGFDGSDLGSFTAAGVQNEAYNEELLFVPQPAGPAKIYHAHYDGSAADIREIDTAGNLIQLFDQTDVVGMALAGTDIWISKWGGRQVGIWDPTTNTFTSQFSTPANAGGLAYDPVNKIMWVGLQGGFVAPYALDGTSLGAGFQPFGNIPDTIDGLTFRGEVTPIPEPGTATLLLAGLVGLGILGTRRNRAS